MKKKYSYIWYHNVINVEIYEIQTDNMYNYLIDCGKDEANIILCRRLLITAPQLFIAGNIFNSQTFLYTFFMCVYCEIFFF